MQKVSGLPSTLPEDVSSVLARVESSESWVKLDSNFGEGQLKLLKMLGAYKSHLPQKIFLEHFVVIATFSKFRDAVTLMQALEVNHASNLQRLLLMGLTRTSPENEFWHTNAMRLRYLTAWNVLSRVFDEERVELIKQALTS